MSQDPIQRGRKWQAFYNEEGGLKDMLDTLEQTYLERMANVSVGNLDGLQTMQLAYKVTQQLRNMVQTIVSGADAAEAAKEYTNRMLAIPAEKRRYM